MQEDTPQVRPIRRGDTGLRILLTVLFVFVGSVLDSLIGLIVIFELAYALVTRRVPTRRVRQLANRVIAYYYRTRRYVTYNESAVPFPFSEFPAELEPVGFPHEESEAELREILDDEAGEN